MGESTDLNSGAASRRAFLAGAGLAGAAVGVGVLAGRADAEPGTRAHTGGRYAIELDGAAAGSPDRATGGHPVGSVIEEPADPGQQVVFKHIGGVKYEDVSVTCGTGMSKQFYDWIKASFDHKEARHSGVVTSWEPNGDVDDNNSFTDALISEVSFPALDAASKDAAKMTIKFHPQTTASVTKPAAKIGVKQKAWLCANFRLKIDNTDCSRVATIDSFTWKVTLTDDGKGTVHPTKVEIPNLKLTVTGPGKDFFEWVNTNVVQGTNDERTGTLTYLTPSGQELFTLGFGGLGIFVVDRQPPTVDNIRRIKAEMYCETMTFKASPAAYT